MILPEYLFNGILYEIFKDYHLTSNISFVISSKLDQLLRQAGTYMGIYNFILEWSIYKLCIKTYTKFSDGIFVT